MQLTTFKLDFHTKHMCVALVAKYLSHFGKYKLKTLLGNSDRESHYSDLHWQTQSLKIRLGNRHLN